MKSTKLEELFSVEKRIKELKEWILQDEEVIDACDFIIEDGTFRGSTLEYFGSIKERTNRSILRWKDELKSARAKRRKILRSK